MSPSETPADPASQQSGTAFRFLFALCLILAAATVWIERAGGQTLIHTVTLEITEQRYVSGRLIRPLSAQSLDQRTAVFTLSEREFSRYDRLADAESCAASGRVCLTSDAYTQGDRSDWVTTDSGGTSASELIAAAVNLLVAQPFVRDDNVAVQLIGFSAGEIRTFRSALENTAAVVWLPDGKIDQQERDELIEIYGSTLTIAGPELPHGAKNRTLEKVLSALDPENSARRSSDRPRFPLAPTLAVLFQLALPGALICALPRAQFPKDVGSKSGGKYSGAGARVLVSAFVLAASTGCFVYPQVIFSRPRFVSDSLVLAIAAGSFLITGYAAGRKLPDPSSAPEAKPVRFLPAFVWLTALPLAIFYLTDNPFRVAGLGSAFLYPGQLATAAWYWPVFTLFAGSLRAAAGAAPKERAALALIVIGTPVVAILRSGAFDSPAAAVLALGAFAVWIAGNVYIDYRRRSSRGARLILALYAALLFSSGIMISL